MSVDATGSLWPAVAFLAGCIQDLIDGPLSIAEAVKPAAVR